jgi:hypothetical protein
VSEKRKKGKEEKRKVREKGTGVDKMIPRLIP